MRTTNFKVSILKSSTLFFTIATFMLSLLLFTSCAESEGVTPLEEDATLINKIELSSRVAVDATSLPAATAVVLNEDLADSFVETVEMAPKLGYRVSVATNNASRIETTSEVFFSIEGRPLEDKSEKRTKRRKKCFQFVFPIDFIMPDDTSITLESKEDWILLKEWKAANPDATEKPRLVFPVDVTLEDGTVQTLIDQDELKTVKDSCRKGKSKKKCFKFVLPVTFTMPDASEIEVNERRDFKLLREWHKANPDVTEKGAVNFPVEVTYKDGTEATINDEAELLAAKESCRD